MLVWTEGGFLSASGLAGGISLGKVVKSGSVVGKAGPVRVLPGVTGPVGTW